MFWLLSNKFTVLLVKEYIENSNLLDIFEILTHFLFITPYRRKDLYCILLLVLLIFIKLYYIF